MTIKTEECENKCLEMLEEKNKKLSDIIIDISKNYEMLSSSQINWIIERFDEYEKYFLTFEDKAKYLNSKGRHRLLERLNYIIEDIREAKQVYQQMYINAINFDKRISETDNRILDKETIKFIFDLFKKEKTDIEENHRIWSNISIRISIDKAYCRYCGNYLGNNHDHCPFCKERL